MDIPKPVAPPRITTKRGIPWIVSGDRHGLIETVIVYAETELDASSDYQNRFGVVPYSVKKKPFVQREHLTDRPFANLNNLLKGDNNA